MRRRRVRIRAFDAVRRPSQRHRRPDADAERPPSASPPQRIDDIDLSCDGAAAEDEEEMVMAVVFPFEDKRSGGEEEGARPPLPLLPQQRPYLVTAMRLTTTGRGGQQCGLVVILDGSICYI